MISKRLTKYVLPAFGGLALLLGGCATSSTPYQPASPSNRVSGGFSEVRLGADRYRVKFTGNTLTSRDKVEGYLLYRAAELTLQQGYQWFEIIEREMDRQVDRQIQPDPFYHPWYGTGYSSWTPYWRYYGRPYGWRTWYPYGGDPFWSNRVDVTTVERFEATAEIAMRRGPRSDGNGRTFDAQEVVNRLGPQIERPQP